MKNNEAELDVDFIGGKDSLTKDEELKISEFIKAQKLLKAKLQKRMTKTDKPQRKKVEIQLK